MAVVEVAVIHVSEGRHGGKTNLEKRILHEGQKIRSRIMDEKRRKLSYDALAAQLHSPSGIALMSKSGREVPYLEGERGPERDAGMATKVKSQATEKAALEAKSKGKLETKTKTKAKAKAKAKKNAEKVSESGSESESDSFSEEDELGNATTAEQEKFLVKCMLAVRKPGKESLDKLAKRLPKLDTQLRSRHAPRSEKSLTLENYTEGGDSDGEISGEIRDAEGDDAAARRRALANLAELGDSDLENEEANIEKTKETEDRGRRESENGRKKRKVEEKWVEALKPLKEQSEADKFIYDYFADRKWQPLGTAEEGKVGADMRSVYAASSPAEDEEGGKAEGAESSMRVVVQELDVSDQEDEKLFVNSEKKEVEFNLRFENLGGISTHARDIKDGLEVVRKPTARTLNRREKKAMRDAARAERVAALELLEKQRQKERKLRGEKGVIQDGDLDLDITPEDIEHDNKVFGDDDNHMWITCDECSYPIQPSCPMFECTECEDFTMCRRCFKEAQHPHRMLKSKVPRDAVVPRTWKAVLLARSTTDSSTIDSPMAGDEGEDGNERKDETGGEADGDGSLELSARAQSLVDYILAKWGAPMEGEAAVEASDGEMEMEAQKAPFKYTDCPSVDVGLTDAELLTLDEATLNTIFSKKRLAQTLEDENDIRHFRRHLAKARQRVAELKAAGKIGSVEWFEAVADEKKRREKRQEKSRKKAAAEADLETDAKSTGTAKSLAADKATGVAKGQRKKKVVRANVFKPSTISDRRMAAFGIETRKSKFNKRNEAGKGNNPASHEE